MEEKIISIALDQPSEKDFDAHVFLEEYAD
jgi:hypothetical protein